MDDDYVLLPDRVGYEWQDKVVGLQIANLITGRVEGGRQAGVGAGNTSEIMSDGRAM